MRYKLLDEIPAKLADTYSEEQPQIYYAADGTILYERIPLGMRIACDFPVRVYRDSINGIVIIGGSGIPDELIVDNLEDETDEQQ